MDFTVTGEGRIKDRTDKIINEVLRFYGLPDSIDEIRRVVKNQHDVYYLSPLMYLKWKKERSYDEYPWRQVTSLNFVVQH
jgi:hypothetical protein